MARQAKKTIEMHRVAEGITVHARGFRALYNDARHQWFIRGRGRSEFVSHEEFRKLIGGGR